MIFSFMCRNHFVMYADVTDSAFCFLPVESADFCSASLLHPFEFTEVWFHTGLLLRFSSPGNNLNLWRDSYYYLTSDLSGSLI